MYLIAHKDGYIQAPDHFKAQDLAHKLIKQGNNPVNIYALNSQIKIKNGKFIISDPLRDQIRRRYKFSEHRLIKNVLKAAGLNWSQLIERNKERDTPYVIARHWIIFIKAVVFGQSITATGAIFGKGHATALHSIKRIREYVTTPIFRRQYTDLITMCEINRPGCFQEQNL